MAKKLNLKAMFETERTKTDNEVLKAIKRYCMNVQESDVNEIHKNILDGFEISSSNDSKYFDVKIFADEIKEQKKIKKEKAKAKEENNKATK